MLDVYFDKFDCIRIQNPNFFLTKPWVIVIRVHICEKVKIENHYTITFWDTGVDLTVDCESSREGFMNIYFFAVKTKICRDKNEKKRPFFSEKKLFRRATRTENFFLI